MQKSIPKAACVDLHLLSQRWSFPSYRKSICVLDRGLSVKRLCYVVSANLWRCTSKLDRLLGDWLCIPERNWLDNIMSSISNVSGFTFECNSITQYDCQARLQRIYCCSVTSAPVVQHTTAGVVCQDQFIKVMLQMDVLLDKACSISMT